MMQNDLAGWWLCERFTVEEAAILLAGGNPGKTIRRPCPELEEMVEVKCDLQMATELGFVSALQSAIESNALPARIARRSYAISVKPNSYCFVEGGGIRSADIDDIFAGPGEGLVDSWKDMLVIEWPIVWDKTTVDRGDLQNWANSRGLAFPDPFPEAQASSQGFLDPKNECFAPELALAVAAWVAVSADHSQSKSPKAAIRQWLDRHGDAWEGVEPLTNEAKDRISTLVNWNKAGGAPKRTP